jgi:PAS domain S-box-containing protein
MENSSGLNKLRAKKSLRRSMLVNLMATALIPLLLLATVVLYYLTERAAEEVSSKNQLLGRAINGQVELFLRGPETSLINLRNLYLSHRGALGHSFQEILDAMAESSRLIESIFILDQNGVVTDVGLPYKSSNLHNEFRQLNLGHLGFIKQARQQQDPVWSDTFLSIITGRTSLALAIPIDDKIIVGNISISLINRFLKELHQNKQVESTIIDRHGEIIACSRKNHDLCPSNLWNLPLLRTAAIDGTATATYQYRGETFLGSVARIDGPNWFTLVAQSSADAYRPVRRTSLLFLTAFLITFVVVLLVALLTSKRITAPLRRFAHQARALADGDYDLQQLNPGYTEIALLADDFQHMADRISERESALKKSEEAYRTLAENLPAIAYRLHIDDCNHLQFMNGEHRKMTGFADNEFKNTVDGCPLEERIHPDDRLHFVTILKQAITDQTPFSQEYRFKHADGEYRIFHEKGCPVYDANGRISHIDGVIFDVTERKQAEEIILQTEKMLTVGGLAAGMAHEINNPLAGILQNSQLISLRLTTANSKNLEIAQQLMDSQKHYFKITS